MGTFHQNKHELHGITVVVETDGDETVVGRCDDMNETQVIMLDADIHRNADDGPSQAEYLAKAARFGVWPNHPRLIIDRARVTSVRRLGDLAT